MVSSESVGFAMKIPIVLSKSSSIGMTLKITPQWLGEETDKEFEFSTYELEIGTQITSTQF